MCTFFFSFSFVELCGFHWKKKKKKGNLENSGNRFWDLCQLERYHFDWFIRYDYCTDAHLEDLAKFYSERFFFFFFHDLTSKALVGQPVVKLIRLSTCEKLSLKLRWSPKTTKTNGKWRIIINRWSIFVKLV